MIRAAYGLFLFAGLIYWLLLLLRSLRSGLLVAVAVSSLVPQAFAWQVLPGSGYATLAHMFVLALVAGFWLRRRDAAAVFGRSRSAGLLLLCGLALLLLLYMFASQNSAYGLSKVGLFLLNSVLPVFALVSLAPLGRPEGRFVLGGLVWASVGAALNLLAYGDIYSQRASVAQVSPITFARSIGLGAVILLASLVVERRRFLSFGGALLFSLSAFLIAAMALTGSRGPILAVGVGVPVATAICGRRAWLHTFARLSALGVLALLLIWAGKSGTQLASIPRLDLYFATTGTNSSDTIRLDYWRISLRSIEDSFSLGEGTGDFAVLVGTTGREYPHNVILEVWVELGILGLLILVLLLVGAFQRIWRLSGALMLPESVGPTVGVAGFAALVFFSLMNASVSGDIPANYQLWISLGMVWLLETNRLPGAPEALSRSASHVLVGV